MFYLLYFFVSFNVILFSTQEYFNLKSRVKKLISIKTKYLKEQNKNNFKTATNFTQPKFAAK